MKCLYSAGLAAVTLVTVTARAAAQQPTPPPAPAPAAAPAPAPAAASAPTPSPVLTAMLEGVTLSPQQQLRVDSILAQFRKEAPPLSPDKDPDEATLATYRKLTQRSLDGVRTVLTREQQQVWDRNVEKVRAASVRVGP